MARVTWKGVTLDARTRDQMEELQRLVGRSITPTQGGYNAGGVKASAGTHDGGGVIDWDIDGLSSDAVWNELYQARRIGLVGWKRTPAQGFSLHVHAVSEGCPDLAPAAAAQVRDYHAGLNGLAGRGRDDGPRDFPGGPGVTWERYLASKIKEVIIVANVWLMQSDTATVYLVREDCTGKVALPSVQVASDILFILQSGGVKVLTPPKDVPRGDVAGRPVWAGVRPETLQAIPTL